MEDLIKKSRNEYMRQWRKKHPEKVRSYQNRFWEKRAAKVEQTGKHDDGLTGEDNEE